MLMTVVLAVATSLGTAYMALSYSAEAAQRHDRQIEDQALTKRDIQDLTRRIESIESKVDHLSAQLAGKE